MTFRARLRAASYSRREMANVMAETLVALGYDVSEYNKGLSLRYDPTYDESDVELEREAASKEGYKEGKAAGEEVAERLLAEEYARGIQDAHRAVEDALSGLR